MKTMSAEEFKEHFEEVIETVKSGETFHIINGENKDVIGYFKRGNVETQLKPKRQLGILKGKGSVVFMDDWEMTEEEFLGL